MFPWRRRRDGAKEHLPLSVRLFVWVTTHRRAATFLFGWALLFVCLLSILAQPKTANAVIPLIPIILGGIVAVVGGGFVLGEAGGAVQDWLRDAVNGFLSVTTSMIASVVQSDLLTKSFNDIFAPVYPIIYNIHQTTVVTTANVVLVIFLVVSLGKMVQEINRTEAGIDMWRVCMIFVLYALGKLVVDNSFELCVLVFDLVKSLIASVVAQGSLSGALTVSPVGGEVKNAGALILMLMTTFVVWAVVGAVCLLSQIVVIGRSIKIYVMTCYAALPLAFFVSDSSRSMATGFIKRYVATLFAGAILALLFIMFGAIVGNMSMTSVTPDTYENIVQWCCEMLFSLTSVIAFGWAVAKSGAWAQEFVGL